MMREFIFIIPAKDERKISILHVRPAHGAYVVSPSLPAIETHISMIETTHPNERTNHGDDPRSRRART
jgi:hypothetical protein